MTEDHVVDRDKIRRIHMLEDNIRNQEIMMELQDKIDTMDSIEVGAMMVGHISWRSEGGTFMAMRMGIVVSVSIL